MPCGGTVPWLARSILYASGRTGAHLGNPVPEWAFMSTLWTTRKRLSPVPAVLLGLACVLLLALLAVLIYGAKWAEQYARTQLQQHLGPDADVRFESLGPAFARIAELRIPGESLNLEANKIEVAYRLQDLPRGHLRRVSVEKAKLNYSLAQLVKHEDTKETAAAFPMEATDIRARIMALPEVSVASLALELHDLNASYPLELSFDLYRQQDKSLRFSALGSGEGINLQTTATYAPESATGQIDFQLHSSRMDMWQRLLARAWPASSKLSWSAEKLDSQGRLQFGNAGIEHWGATLDTLKTSLELPEGGAQFAQLVLALRGDSLGLSGASVGGRFQQISAYGTRAENGGIMLNFDPGGGLHVLIEDTQWLYQDWLKAEADLDAKVSLASPLSETTAEGSTTWRHLSLGGISLSPSTAVFSADKQQLILAAAALGSPQLEGLELAEVQLFLSLLSDENNPKHNRSQDPSLEPANANAPANKAANTPAVIATSRDSHPSASANARTKLVLKSSLNYKAGQTVTAPTEPPGVGWALTTSGSLDLSISELETPLVANYQLRDTSLSLTGDSWSLKAQPSGNIALEQSPTSCTLMPNIQLPVLQMQLPGGIYTELLDGRLQYDLLPMPFTTWQALADKLKQVPFWQNALQAEGTFNSGTLALPQGWQLALQTLQCNYDTSHLSLKGKADLLPSDLSMSCLANIDFTESVSLNLEADLPEQTLTAFRLPESLGTMLAKFNYSGKVKAHGTFSYQADSQNRAASALISLKDGLLESEALGFSLSGLDLQVDLQDALQLQTAERQVLRFAKLQTGALILENGEVEYTAHARGIQIHRGQANWAGGVVMIEPVNLAMDSASPDASPDAPPDAPPVIRILIADLQLEALRPLVFEQAKALQGRVGGVWEFAIHEDGVRPVRGSLRMNPGSNGHIEYVAPGWTEMLYSGDDALATEYRVFLEKAMEALDVSDLQVNYNPAPDGEQSLDLVLRGSASIEGRSINVNMQDLAIVGDLERFLDLGIFFKQFNDLSVSFD